jgi:hypothetical protein
MAALDVAMTPFPEAADQRASVVQNLAPALDARLCVTATGAIEVTLTNARIGHAWPTGAAHDRRAWLEVIAWAAGAQVFSSGAVAEGETPEPPLDPSLLLLRETLTDAHGAEAPFLWSAAAARATTIAAGASVTARYTAPPNVDRVTVRVRVVPIAPSIVRDLVASGDLDPVAYATLPSFELRATSLEWTKDRGAACLP